NEEENIEVLANKIKESFVEIRDYEVIWINDGSVDKTYEVLKKIADIDKRNKYISLMSRTGQSGAIMAGINKSSGKYIATLDGDNQNDPSDLIKMYKLIESSDYDAIVGWRKNRWKGNIFRRLPSLIANKIIKLSFPGVNIHDAGCPVKIVKGNIIREVKLYGELHRFLTYIIGSMGAKIGEIEVTHRKRSKGKSKYGIGRTLKVIFDIINLKFLFLKRTTPIMLTGPIALTLLVVAFASSVYLTVNEILYDINITGEPLFLVTIMSIIMATQFISIGLLGELVIRSYYETNNKKTYMIRDSNLE
ncbi:MAG TPA: glycosyltransferase, partial [bacterium]|nr:glycosyltransferase [bacterium]